MQMTEYLITINELLMIEIDLRNILHEVTGNPADHPSLDAGN